MNKRLPFVYTQRLVLLLVLLLGLACPGQAQVYYTLTDGAATASLDQLRQVSANGTGDALIKDNFVQSAGLVVVDATNNRLLVADTRTSQSTTSTTNTKIVAVSLAAGNAVSTVFTPATIPMAVGASTTIGGLAIDKANSHIYYTLFDATPTTMLDQLRRVNSNGTGDILIKDNFVQTAGPIVFDAANNRVLVVDTRTSQATTSTTNTKIVAVSLSTGNAVTTIVTPGLISGATSAVIGGLTLDKANNYVYYTVSDGVPTASNDQLRRVNGDGTGDTFIKDNFVQAAGPVTLDLANNRLLAVDSRTSQPSTSTTNTKIVAVSLATGNAVTTVVTPAMISGAATSVITDVAVPAVDAPTVTTAAATSVAATSATLGGNVTADGGDAVDERGVVYVAGTGTPNTGNTKALVATSGIVIGTPFSGTVSGLAASTQYTVRAYAINAAGTSYGSPVAFTTPAATTSVVSINRTGTTPTNAASVSYTVTFAASVTGLSASNFGLVATGVAGANITGVSGSGTTYTVAVSTGTGDGTLGLNLTTAAGLTPGLSNALPFVGQVYTIDKTAPTVTITSPVAPDGGYTTTAPLTYVLTFSEDVSNPTVSVTNFGGGSIVRTSASTFTASVTPGGPGAVRLSVNANTAADAAGNTSPTASYTIFYNVPTTAPVLTSPANNSTVATTLPTYAGTAPAGSTVTVYVNGTSIGTTTASGTTGTGSFSLAQPTALANGTTYTVYATALASGQTVSANSNTNTFTTPAATATVVAITRQQPSPTALAQVSYLVTFSASVSGVTTNNFFPTIASGSIGGASIASVSGAGTTRTVVVNTGTGNGDLRLDVVNSNGTTPTLTNVPYTSGELYTITKSFAAAPRLVLRGAGSPTNFGDVTAFVDQVQVVQNGTSTAVTNGLQNGSFETNNLSAAPASYNYGPVAVASPWTIGTQAGLSRNGTTGFGSTAADGTVVAFLQNGGPNSSVAQSLAVPTGSYQVTFGTRQRSNNGVSDQVVNVYLNNGVYDVFLGTIQPTSYAAYESFTSAAFTVVAPPLTATVSTTSASPTSTAPIPFAVDFTASGNPQSVGTTFTASDVTVTNGSIVAGSFSGSGSGPYTFTVMPTGPGTVSVRVAQDVASDANNTLNSASNTLNVQYQVLTLSPTTLPNGATGTAYSQAFTASGATAPYSYTITAGVLPAGLTLTSGGVLSGTPTAVGTFTFTVTATDASAAPGPYTVSRSYTLTISPGTTTVASVTRLNLSPTATAQVSYRVVFTTSVAGLTTNNFTATGTNGSISGASVSSITPVSGTAYTVVVNTGTGNGDLRLDVTSSAGTTPTIANVPYTAGEVYTITKSFAAAPTLRIQAAGSASGNSDVTAFVDAVQVLQSGTSTVVPNGLQNGSFETNNVPPNGFKKSADGVVAAPWSFTGTAGVARYGSPFDSQVPGQPQPLPPNGDAVVLIQSAGNNNASISQNLAVPTGSYQVNFQMAQRYYTSVDQRLNVFVNDVFVGNIQTGQTPAYGPFTSATFNVFAPDLMPTISSTAGASGSSTATTPIPFTVTFPQAVTGFDATDVTVSGGTLQGFTAVNGTTYTFAVVPAGNGAVTVSVPANGAVDANNTSNRAAGPYTLNFAQPVTAAPVVTAPANNSRTNNTTPTYAGTAVAGSTVTVYVGPSPGTAISIGSTLANGSNSWSLAQPTALADGAYQVYATAQAPNSSVSANSATITFTVDTGRPSVTLTSSSGASGSTNAAAPFLFTATFSEGVSGFVAGDLSVTNGTVSNFTGAAGSSVYTFSVTPTTPGVVTSVFVYANSNQDLAGNGNTASNTYSLTSAPPVVTVAPASTTLTSGTVGTAYSQAFTASGATAPYMYAITAGALPAGLTLSAAGVLSGTPTASGTFGFTVTATDASATPGPYSGARAYTLVIAAPATVTWTGNNSSDWFDPANWNPNLVPTATTSATIPAGRPNMPAIGPNAQTAATRHLTLNAGAVLNMSANTLDVQGSLTNNGTLAAGGGTVVLGTSTLASLLGSSSTRFWNLTVAANGAQLSTSAGAAVQRVLTLDGNLATNGNPLTLESNASGTAMVVNNGSNAVVGATTAQRYIDPSLNPNAGYRHVSAPIGNATVASLATASFTPVVNPAYNTSATPNLVRAFPTVYGYDQSRLATTNNNMPAFDKGWYSPAALSDPLAVGQGYTVLIGGGQTWSFTGPLNNGDVTVSLARNSGATASDAGYALIGNPYPAPLDWGLVQDADRPNVGRTIYVYRSTDPSNPYMGIYGFYNNGIGTITSTVAQGQGFFVQVAPGQTAGAVNLKNSHRATSYSNPAFQRSTAETRPLVHLTLHGAAQQDDAFVYAEAGATTGYGAQFDAEKLANPTGLNLSSAAAGHDLAINGLPAFTAGTVVPLSVGVPAAGTYALRVAELLNLPAGTAAVLVDAQLGTQTDLATLPAAGYAFAVSPAQVSALIRGRFFLNLVPAAAPLASAAGRTGAVLALYPNPTAARAATLTGAPAGAKVTVLDAVGRLVLSTTATAAGTAQLLLPEGAAMGVYVVRAGSQALKLVVE